jgi:ABC-type Fe3+/spermidine/putrescine transport system ATPase subunit
VLSAADGVVEWEGEKLRARLNGETTGQAVTLSVRPEKLTLSVAGTDAALNRLAGVVEVITFLGPVVRVEVIVRGRPLWVDVAHGQARALGRKKPVTLAFGPDDCVVLAAPARH